ncbi:hypothetical protein CC1G_06772 [Coprinopsis cinerea okayama7|uniref:Uncharacterized protein n=1 Tax=Coprinopsis cinerea (strain Okayama-7 / 130 / ATCC MYA-4618 / FGSC 9003) TaxID=240176 RepID=A8N1L3_COPC7|nr:hypothetical protein CC1G_06772 [Coprinopsis cinerea okayama7\|eukprot:XP_001828786.2 hypothetical protein CC1G_06772 [Coprinopsis cinerea okayama7\
MPTSTEPFEVLFEFTNDGPELVTLQLTPGSTTEYVTSSPSVSEGPTTRLYPKESVSLVLNAGATYHYMVKQSTRKAQISYK